MTRRDHFRMAENLLELDRAETDPLVAKILRERAAVHALLATADVQVAP